MVLEMYGPLQSEDFAGAPLSRWCIFLSIVLATLLLAWPAALNRGPFFIADTTGYLRGADAVFSSAFKYNSIWSDKRDAYVAKSGKSETLAEPRLANARVRPAHPPLRGRSIYYGAVIYFPVLLLGENAGIVIQSVLCAIVIWLALVPIGVARRRNGLWVFFGAIALLAALTSLPFTATLLLPDYLTGLSCAAFVVLLLFWADYGRWEIAILAGVIAFASLSHSSNLPILLAMGLLGLLIGVKLKVARLAAAIALCAVAIGVAGDALFVSAVIKKTGMTPIRPPFLTARLIADGPGYDLLGRKCPQHKFEICRYAARTPYDSDQFLWSEGKDGVFSIADYDSQSRLSREDMKFAIATFLQFPLATVESSVEASGRQLVSLDLRIWHGDGGGRPFYELSNLPIPVAKRMGRTLSVRGVMPVEPWQSVIAMTMLGAILIAVLCIYRGWRSGDERLGKFGLAIALVIFAIVLNAVITGALSKPDARYNLRIIWLLPFFTYNFTMAVRHRRVQ